MLLLGYDVGTTRTKLIALDTSSGETESVSRPTPVLEYASGDLRDAESVFAVLVELTNELGTRVELGKVVAVAVASVGEEIVLLDGTGRSSGPTPTWYTVSDPLPTGGPKHRESSWYKLASLRRESAFDLCSAVAFTDLGSYLSMRIAGAASPFMDLSHASRTALLSLADPIWDKRELDASGGGHLQTPLLVASGTPVGTVAAQELIAAGLLPTTVVTAGGHDHFCGAFGAGVRRTGDVYISVGTSESQLVLVNRSSTVRSDDEFEAGYFVDGRHRYLHSSYPSGRRFAQIIKRHEWQGKIDTLYQLLELHVDGERTYIGTLADELVTELRLQAARAAEVTDRLEERAGINVGRIIIGGIPASYALWRQIRSEASQRKLHFVTEPELTGIGVALLAQQGMEASVL